MNNCDVLYCRDAAGPVAEQPIASLARTHPPEGPLRAAGSMGARSAPPAAFHFNRGFLLFEVMVAVSVVGIAMATILQTISSSLAASRMAGDYFIAGTLLSEKLWEINSRGNAVPGDAEGTFTGNTRYHYKIAVEELFAETAPSSASPNGSDSGLSAVFQERTLAKITLIVSWEHRGKSKSLTAQTYLPIQEEQMVLKQINYLQ